VTHIKTEKERQLLTGEVEEGWQGAHSYDRKKPWWSYINHSILSVFYGCRYLIFYITITGTHMVSQVIGRLDLGGERCEGSALHHWQEIQTSPRRQIAEWHKLKPE
jgi:hypothetical protein